MIAIPLRGMGMIIAMIMSFYINARLASVYLVAILILGTCLFLIMRSAMKYFDQAFPKYDELNARWKPLKPLLSWETTHGA